MVLTKKIQNINHGCCIHGNRKLTLVLLLQIIIYNKVLSIKIIYCCGYKNKPKPTIVFKMTYALYKNNVATLLKKTIEPSQKILIP